MGRRCVIAGNWKMHKTVGETVAFIRGCRERPIPPSPCIYLAVPFTALQVATDCASGSPVIIGAQNMAEAIEGAFTGEISARMLRDVSAQFVILGHSERRRLYREGDEEINRKVLCALEYGLQPLLCVGETEEQHAEGASEQVVARQLSVCLQGVTQQQISQVMIAYEPVWAIGTGKTATRQHIQPMQQACRALVAKHWGQETAEEISLLYGGSVHPGNVEELLECPETDGLLVGSASLSLATFMEIIDNAARVRPS